MNILFLTLGGLKNIEDRGIYSDLLRTFKNKGHQITIVSPLERRSNKETEVINRDNVTYLNVKIGNITKTNVIEKGISTLLIETQYLNAIKKNLNHIKFDLVLYSTPPITFEKVIRFIKNRDQAKTYLLLKDIFPQNAVDLNMFSEKSLINKFFRNKERKLYAISDYIGCMSQANVDYVLKNNPELVEEKVEICPNSIEPIEMKIEEIEKSKIRKKYHIPEDKTVFIYGGNLGKPQGIDYLSQCLLSNKANADVHFVIAGSGTEFNKLKVFLEFNAISNAQLLSELPKHDYEVLVNSCDVGLIFLDHRFTIPNFPSRLLSYMQASMPILAATDANTDIGKIIEEGEFGYWCESNNVTAFNQKLNRLLNQDLRMKMGTNARKYLEENYTAEHSYNIIFKKINEN